MSNEIPGHQIELGPNHKVGVARKEDGGVYIRWMMMKGEAAVETKVCLSKEAAEATWFLIRRALQDNPPCDIEITAKEATP